MWLYVVICQNMPKHANKSTPTKALNLAIILQYTAKYYKKTHPLCDYIGTYRNIQEQNALLYW